MELSAVVDDYREIISGHPHFNAAYKKLRKSIRHAVIGNIILVYGPTGVGKSTLLKHLMREILSESIEKISANRSIMPIVRIEVDYPDGNKFSWIEFYRSALIALQEPMIDKKFKNIPARSKLDLSKNVLENKATGHVLKAAFLSALSERKTKILLLDEAHHIARGFEGEKLKWQLEYLKSLANKNNIIIVLIGTYDLIAFRDLSGQLSRRSLDVPFSRYSAQKKDDVKKFIKIVNAFKNQSPLPWDDEVFNDFIYLYTYSVGCVGILKDWIDRAHISAMYSESKTLTLEHFKGTELTVQQLKKITEELVNGESSLKTNKNDLKMLQVQLGIDITTAPVIIPADIETTSDQPYSVLKSKVKLKRKTVGIRKPKRDSLGIESKRIK